jgi:hypothetical protein
LVRWFPLAPRARSLRVRGMTALGRRSLTILALTCVGYAALVATHAGEFWPFSTFSMFARAGRPWQRALVRSVDGRALEGHGNGLELRSYTLDELPGSALPLQALDIPQNDLSGLVQRAEAWGQPDLDALAKLFGALPCRTPLLVLRVTGALAAAGVSEVVTPAALLGCEEGHVWVRALAKEPA